MLLAVLMYRIVNASDLVTLPVVYHSRLFKAATTAVAFSPCGSYVAVAAASTGRVALLKVAAAGQQVQLLGYVKAEGESCAAGCTS
jgi:6-phosphogluconolactonase (cycloisomerase 2 family)